MQAMQKGPIHPTPVTQTQGPLPKNRWTPERHKVRLVEGWPCTCIFRCDACATRRWVYAFIYHLFIYGLMSYVCTIMSAGVTQTYPKDFRDVAMLLLLNSQAHERRAPNPAARVPPVIWQQVRLR